MIAFIYIYINKYICVVTTTDLDLERVGFPESL